MKKPEVAIVTGAGGELGRVLLPELARRGIEIVALDLTQLPRDLASLCRETVQMNILDVPSLQLLLRRHAPSYVYHLAALLSAHAERDPDLAHRVNVDGTLGLLKLCWRFDPGPVRFLFPSSIAVYGLPDVGVKRDQGALKEWQWTTPRGVYGCNKLYCELIGTYLSRRPPGSGEGDGLDFRSIRFPGLISAETLPSGGTTDYAPEMIHAAAKGEAYSCFVREDSRLPFMTMPDAVAALLQLAEVDAARLTTRVYNIRGFSCSAGEIRDEVLRFFPQAKVVFEPRAERQAIVDSWPADVDDGRARRDWGLAPRHGLAEAFGDYLVPALQRLRT
jgi:threonine 3-dehydrogenase